MASDIVDCETAYSIFSGIMQKIKGREDRCDSDFLEVGLKCLEFHKGDLITLASSPLPYKTYFAINILQKLSVEKHIPACYLSVGLEKNKLIGSCLFSLNSKVGYRKIYDGFFRSEDVQKINQSFLEIKDSPIYVVNLPNCRFGECCDKIQSLVEEKKIELLFIDDFFLFEDLLDNDNPSQYRKKLGEIMIQLRQMALDYKIPIILMIDMLPKNEKKKLTLSDFKKNMIIPYLSDMVIFINQNERSDDACMEWNEIHDVTISVEKNKHGLLYDFDVQYNPELSLFE